MAKNTYSETTTLTNKIADVTINNSDRNNFLEAMKLLFEGNEFALSRDKENAQKSYVELMTKYKELSQNLKLRIFPYASKLRKKIIELGKLESMGGIECRRNPNHFVMYNGMSIKDLNHMVYALDNISDYEFQYHVNSIRNELIEWIETKLGEKELAGLLSGFITKDQVKTIIWRYLLMKKFDSSLNSPIHNFN